MSCIGGAAFGVGISHGDQLGAATAARHRQRRAGQDGRPQTESDFRASTALWLFAAVQRRRTSRYAGWLLNSPSVASRSITVRLGVRARRG